MNIGFWLCEVLVIPFVIIGVLFAIFKEKAAKFVSGFNSLPKEEQALYDKTHISRDIKNQCFTWAGIMLVGAVLSYFLTPYMAIPFALSKENVSSLITPSLYAYMLEFCCTSIWKPAIALKKWSPH